MELIYCASVNLTHGILNGCRIKGFKYPLHPSVNNIGVNFISESYNNKQIKMKRNIYLYWFSLGGADYKLQFSMSDKLGTINMHSVISSAEKYLSHMLPIHTKPFATRRLYVW